MSEAVILSIVSLIGTIVVAGFAFIVNLYRIKSDNELQELKSTVDKLTKNNRALWSYLVSTLDHMRRKNIKPLPLPNELQTDPELARLVMFEPRKVKQPRRKQTA